MRRVSARAFTSISAGGGIQASFWRQGFTHIRSRHSICVHQFSVGLKSDFIRSIDPTTAGFCLGGSICECISFRAARLGAIWGLCVSPFSFLHSFLPPGVHPGIAPGVHSFFHSRLRRIQYLYSSQDIDAYVLMHTWWPHPMSVGIPVCL